MAALIDEGFAISMADYQEALAASAWRFATRVARTLAGVDALVTPATPAPAPGESGHHRRSPLQLALEPRRRADRFDPLRADRSRPADFAAIDRPGLERSAISWPRPSGANEQLGFHSRAADAARIGV